MKGKQPCVKPGRKANIFNLKWEREPER